MGDYQFWLKCIQKWLNNARIYEHNYLKISKSFDFEALWPTHLWINHTSPEYETLLDSSNHKCRVERDKRDVNEMTHSEMVGPSPSLPNSWRRWYVIQNSENHHDHYCAKVKSCHCSKEKKPNWGPYNFYMITKQTLLKVNIYKDAMYKDIKVFTSFPRYFIFSSFW